MKSVAALLLLASLSSAVSAAFPTLTLKQVVAKQLVSPVSLAHAGDGSKRLFICEQDGQIRILQHGMLLPEPFLDLGSKVLDISASSGADERGLLGLAFHPDYANDGQPGHGRFYVYYSKPYAAGTDEVPAGWTIQPNHVGVLVEFQVSENNPNRADPDSERRLLTFAQPQSNHNGGQIEFGPDGWLYLASGDGGSSNDNNSGHTGGDNSRPDNALGNSQDRSNLLGKILRLDPLGDDGPGGQYGIPPDNPFVGVAGVREEIYAFGLRNPWRFSFDNFGAGATNRLFCADVGQGKVEEINLIASGGNYGWRRWEGGFDLFPNTPNPSGIPPTPPIAAYAHPGQGAATGLPEFGISITGGYVYRGAAIPALHGKYVFADYSTAAALSNGILLGLEETSPGVFGPVTALPLTDGNPLGTRVLALGRDEDGELYVATKEARGATAPGDDSLPSGALLKVIPATQELILTAARDTSLFEESNHSNAKGTTFFTGKIGYPSNGETPPGALRRALLAFDLAAVPSGLTLQSAAVSLHLDAAGSPGHPFDVHLHKITQGWAEGTSQASRTGGTGASPTANDATWNHRTYNSSLWTAPGGDFVGTASASTPVANAGQTYLWQSAGLLADVQSWLAEPATNHGWMVRGDETEYYSAMRFFTREWTTPAQRPRLILTYVAASAPSRRETWLAQHYPDEPAGFYLDPAADEDGDGLASEFEYALDLDPHTANDVELLTVEVRPGDEGGTDHVFHFHRHASATDLDLLLEFRQAAGDWQVLARSEAGAAMTAENGAEVITDEAVNGNQYTVSVRLHAPDESPLGRGFGRLRLERRTQ